MNGPQYTILAYVIGLTLLWGYAVSMWLEARRMSRNAPGEKP
jgi:hypothetical protein